jgi:hypothetical protein
MKLAACRPDELTVTTVRGFIRSTFYHELGTLYDNNSVAERPFLATLAVVGVEYFQPTSELVITKVREQMM